MKISERILKQEDLINNPTARVPICLCLDTSGSMGRIIGGDIKQTGRTEYKDGEFWNIVTGGISAINELNDGVKLFFDEIASDDMAKYSAEICVVTFGGNAPKLIADYASVDQQRGIPELVAEGETPMGEAVNLALDCLERRKNEYKEAGVDYFQPWLVLMTDGYPTGSKVVLERAIERTVSLVNQKKLVVFPIAIGPEASKETLSRFSPKNEPLKLNDMKFREFFQWLSRSVSTTSQSMPGEKVKLPTEDIKGWAEV